MWWGSWDTLTQFQIHKYTTWAPVYSRWWRCWEQRRGRCKPSQTWCQDWWNDDKVDEIEEKSRKMMREMRLGKSTSFKPGRPWRSSFQEERVTQKTTQMCVCVVLNYCVRCYCNFIVDFDDEPDGSIGRMGHSDENHGQHIHQTVPLDQSKKHNNKIPKAQ